MAYGFNVVGWEDANGNRHDGAPGSTDGVYGQLIEAVDPVTGQTEFFWAFIPEEFDSMDEWYDYIETLMDMYGLELA